MPMPKIITEMDTVAGRQGLKSIEEKWNRVADKVKNRKYYHLYHWYMAHMEAMEAQEDSVQFYVGYCNDEPVIVVPYKRCKRRVGLYKLNTIEIPQHDHSHFGDLVVDADLEPINALKEVIQYFQKSVPGWDCVVFPQLPDDSVAVEVARSGKIPMLFLETVRSCFTIPCQCEGEEGNSRVSKSTKSTLNHSQNKLSRIGQVSYVWAKEPQDLLWALKEFLKVEASGWKGNQGSAIACDLDTLKFYQLIVDAFGPSSSCRIALLRLDGKTIAATFGLLVDGTLFLLKTGFNEDFAKMSPGRLLHHHLVGLCIEEPEIRLLNTITAPAWVRNWKPHCQEVRTLFVFRPSLAGAVGLGLTYLRHQLRPYYHQIRNLTGV